MYFQSTRAIVWRQLQEFDLKLKCTKNGRVAQKRAKRKARKTCPSFLGITRCASKICFPRDKEPLPCEACLCCLLGAGFDKVVSGFIMRLPHAFVALLLKRSLLNSHGELKQGRCVQVVFFFVVLGFQFFKDSLSNSQPNISLKKYMRNFKNSQTRM